MFCFTWSRLFLWFPVPSVLFSSLWRSFKACQLQMVTVSSQLFQLTGKIHSKYYFTPREFFLAPALVWTSDRDRVIQTILCVLDGFWFGWILFIRMVEVYSLAKFSEDQPSHPVVPSLVLLLCEFTAFTYYAFNRLLTISTSCILDILLLIINLRLDILVLIKWFWAWIKRDWISLLKFC